MAPRTTRRRRPGRPRRSTQAASTNGAARVLLAEVSALVEANEALMAENALLQSVLNDVGRAISASASAPRRPGRPPASAAARTGGRPTTGPKRRRRRITDPATLERRRAGLAKARAVLAAKRAAAKRKG